MELKDEMGASMRCCEKCFIININKSRREEFPRRETEIAELEERERERIENKMKAIERDEQKIKRENQEREERNRKQIEEQKAEKDRIEKIIIEREKYEREAKKIIAEYCMKYLSNKSAEFKDRILDFYSSGFHEELDKEVVDGDINFLTNYLSGLRNEADEVKPSNAEEYDAIKNNDKFLEDSIQLLHDIEKLEKIIRKRSAQTNYQYIIQVMVDTILDEKENKVIEAKVRFKTNLKPIVIRIQNLLLTDRKEIVFETLKYNPIFTLPWIFEMLFEMLEMEYDDSEVNSALTEWQAERELLEFEESLGKPQQMKLGDFQSLSGYEFEEYLGEVFSILNYDVIQTKLSGDQGADLILIKGGEKIVVQAKKFSGSVSNQAIQQVVASIKYYDADKSMVVTTGTFTKSAMELALSNNVDLWDGKKLQKAVTQINQDNATESITSHDNSTSSTISYSDGQDHFSMICNICLSKVNIPMEVFSSSNTSVSYLCSACGANFSFKILPEDLECEYCSSTVDTYSDIMIHLSACAEKKRREFKCDQCCEDFILDDHEFQEYESKGEVNSSCPRCDFRNTLVKAIDE
jgi:HJR/Mrr/RecB family endonuclease/DNA-directed RNA polymerase subunit RPC12/RpoP